MKALYRLEVCRARQAGATASQVSPHLDGASFTRSILKPVLAADALLVSDGRSSYGVSAEDTDLLHMPSMEARVNASLAAHLEKFKTSIRSLKLWHARFKGVATPTSRAISDGDA